MRRLTAFGLAYLAWLVPMIRFWFSMVSSVLFRRSLLAMTWA